jgi:hypothetical protein
MVQRMENALSVHHLVASVEAGARKRCDVMDDSDLETEFLRYECLH